METSLNFRLSDDRSANWKSAKFCHPIVWRNYNGAYL